MLPDLLRDDPLGFWARLGRARRPLLGLDYDGTLAPFRVDRMAAVPATGAVDALRAIIEDGRTSTVVISGRLAEEVVTLLGDLGVMVLGSHGFERRWPDGRLERASLPATQEQALLQAEERVQALGLGVRLERKAASLAFHTRGLAEAQELERQVWELWADPEAGLRRQRFNGGVELRAGGINKGTVLAGLLREHQPDLAVYIGDDQTDEDAFRTLATQGEVGIKVGPGQVSTVELATVASAGLPDCDGVVQFLRRWLTTLETAGE